MRKKEKKERTKEELAATIFVWLAAIFCLVIAGWVVMAIIDFGMAITALFAVAGIVVMIFIALFAAAGITEAVVNALPDRE